MTIGERAKVVANAGGLFYGRTGLVVKLDTLRARPYVGLRFDDGERGSGREYWFEPHELVPA